jgi:hypoxanthine-guanine phosphoribosyltransferase
MRALVGLLLLSIALSVLSSASRAQELGRCEPTKAVKIIDDALGEGKTLQQAMEMMIKAKVFDGSKACITFIRETSMTMRDAHPSAFKSLWMN